MTPVRASNVGTTQVICIDRPPVDALDLDTIRRLGEAFATAAKEPPAGGVVLTGTGSTFSAGVDTRAYASYDEGQRRALMQSITKMTASLLDIRVPVVAAVNGHALVDGFVLMLGTDWRMAADAQAARFALSEEKAGVPFPEGPLRIIRHERRPELLRRFTLGSEPVSADVLLREGVFDVICAAEKLLAAAVSRAQDLASQPAFFAVKRQIRGDLAREVAGLVEAEGA